MDLRRLGQTGLKVSAIGLGGNTFGGTAGSDESVAIIRRALELGITLIDTADAYGNGRSEELIGRAVEGRRNEVVLATKVGWPLGTNPNDRGLSRRWIMQAVEGSLRRLNTDYIDLYQAHLPDHETPIEETLRAMDDLIRQGKVRYVGCSNHAAWQLMEACLIAERRGLAPWISAQNRWNILEGLDDPHLLPACGKLGVGIIPFQPLAAGMLTGKYRPGDEPPRGTRLGDLPHIRKRMTDAKLATVERLRPWAEQRGQTTAALGVAWLLAHPAVATVLVGARTLDQLEQNVTSADWKLSAAERDEVLALAAPSA